VIYVKGILAALGAAFVVSVYTLFVVTSKTKVTGRGALVAYFASPFFWITLIVTALYAFRLTTAGVR